MVKTRHAQHRNFDEPPSADLWLQRHAGKRSEKDLPLIRKACELSERAGSEKPTLGGISCFQQGLAMADILDDLSLDAETLAAALVYSSVRHAGLSLDTVSDQLGKKVEKLIRGVTQMDAISTFTHSTDKNSSHIENLRKMLLAMVDDMRVVLVKLAEHVILLRTAKVLTEETRKQFSNEALEIYAPLANRLGLGQLKWELEDLAFRYREPITYKELSKLIDHKRADREHYVERVIHDLENILDEVNISQKEITGRAKHIYSIYRKMHRKHVDFNQIYDVIAVRVLVPTVEDCYTALSAVHTTWSQIPKEFDDYIAQPKENGYRSIHTAVVGPEERNIEVQIRTFDMHKEAELGIAAHWRYKEGVLGKTDYENKIEWLRQVLAWEKELGAEVPHHDRVYVFTPTNDIVDLPHGATPLDFAYHIHSQIGHRCRGAKINNAIVPLTYQLRTGDRIEILTAKEPNPSRDWINPHLGYVKTSRAKAKILQWFNTQNLSKNLSEGRDMLERELKRQHLSDVNFEELAKKTHFKSVDDMFAALGRGDIRMSQVMAPLQTSLMPDIKTEEPASAVSRQILPKRASDIYIPGVGRLLTHVAKCCQPQPGDPIIGYITQGQGVSIHRQACINVTQNIKQHEERRVEVEWRKLELKK